MKVQMGVFSVLITGMLVILNLPAVYADEEKSLTIEGVVKDNQQRPLPGARIEVHETGHTTTTDTSGAFKIEGLSPGSYHVHVYMMGFASTAQRVRLSSSGAYISFQLRRSELELGEMVIEAEPYRMVDREKSLDMSVVNREAMQRHRRVSFAETLERTPGVRSINTGQGISKPVLRGLSFHRIAVVDRGIKQESQQWGADHGLEIDPYDVERVEIIKGPNTILYGSDASGGVVNISTPSFPPKNTIRGNINFTGASNTDLLGGSAMVEGNKENFVYRFRYSRQEYGDYRVPADSFNYGGYIMPVHENRLKNTAGKEEAFTGTLGLQRDWGSSQVTFSHFGQEAGLFPGAFGHPGTFSLQHEDGHRSVGLPRQVNSHTKLISNSKFNIGKSWLETDIGYQFNHRREEAVPHAHDNRPLPESINHLELQLHTISGNARFHTHHTDNLSAIYGVSGEYHENESGGFEFLIPDHEGWDAGAFAYYNYQTGDNYLINGGLRYDYGDLTSFPFEEPTYDQSGEIDGTFQRAPLIERNFSNFSGTMGGSYFPADEWTFKANIARHFRVPRAPELASEGFHHGTFRHERGDADLNSETGYQLDLSGEYQTHNFLVSFTPFFNYYENYIYLRPTFRFSPPEIPGSGQIYQYEENTARMWGGEAVIEYHPIADLHLEVAADMVRSQNLDSQLPLPLTPPVSLFFEAQYTFPDIGDNIEKPYLNLNVDHYGDQTKVDRNERATEGGTIFNLAAGNTFNFSETFDMKLYFQVQNILNSRYMDHLSYYRMINLPEPGRNYQLTIEIPFRTNHF